MEIWKDIKGYEGWYEVSSMGRVRSWYSRNNGNQYQSVNGPLLRSKPKILKPFKLDHGYLVVSLYNDNKGRRITIHRLVAQAFIPNPENKPCVNHRDGNKENNSIGNLEWCTHQENHTHASINGLKAHGKEHYKTSLTDNDILDMRNAYALGCFTQKEIAEAYEISRSQACGIINRKFWKHV